MEEAYREVLRRVEAAVKAAGDAPQPAGAGPASPSEQPAGMWRATVRLTIRPGILDPQGQAVRGALHALGFAEVRDVRVGRLVQLTLAAPGAPEARERAEAMCRLLLANAVTEDYAVEVAPA